VSDILDSVLLRCAAPESVVISPVAHIEGRKQPYGFILCGADDEDGIYLAHVCAADPDLVEAARNTVITEAATHPSHLVVHVCDSELLAAKTCVAIWPCDKAMGILAAVSAELSS